MNHNKPKAAVRVLALASAVALAATATVATSASAADSPTIGFSPLSLQIPALAGMSHGVEGYAGSKGAKVLLSDPNLDPAKQVSDLSNWIKNKQVDGFWALSVAAQAVGPVLKEAQAAGIVAVVNGVPSDYGFSGLQKGITFSRIPYEKLGTGLGKKLGQCLTFRAKKKAASVIYVASPAGQVGAAEQEKAFKAALKAANPKAKIVATVNGNGDRATSQNVVRAALQAHPEANGLISFNDEGSLGGASAFKAAGKKTAASCIVGAGGGDEAKAAVKAGTLYVLGEFLFGADLAQTVDELLAMAKNPSAVGRQMVTPIKFSTKTSN